MNFFEKLFGSKVNNVVNGFEYENGWDDLKNDPSGSKNYDDIL